MSKNAEIIAKHFSFAEHPPDDDEPLTAEWWVEKLGNRHVELFGEFALYFSSKSGAELYAEGSGQLDQCYTLILPHIKTRGDVRRLARALGVELKGESS